MRTNGVGFVDFSQKSDLQEKKTTRINFIAPLGLVRRVKLLASENKQTQSDIIRRALEFFITQYEQDKIAREIEEACEFYYDIDRKIAAKWRSAEQEV